VNEHLKAQLYRKVGHEDGLDLYQTWQDGCCVAEDENARLRDVIERWNLVKFVKFSFPLPYRQKIH